MSQVRPYPLICVAGSPIRRRDLVTCLGEPLMVRRSQLAVRVRSVRTHGEPPIGVAAGDYAKGDEVEVITDIGDVKVVAWMVDGPVYEHDGSWRDRPSLL